MKVGLLELPQASDARGEAGRAPRRYSTVRGDRGYPPWKLLDDLGIGVEVHLDGLGQRDVYTADEGERLIVRMVRGSDGHPMLTPARDEILTETVHGEVTFSFRAR